MRTRRDFLHIAWTGAGAVAPVFPGTAAVSGSASNSMTHE